MRGAKALYFCLCFTVICIFFYFFCNSKQRTDVDYIKIYSYNGIGYPSLVAYSRDSTEVDLEACNVKPQLRLEDIYASNNLWQIVPDAGIFLYATYLDHRSDKPGSTQYHVRILGMSKGVTSRRLYCQLWSSKSNTATISKVEQDEIWVQNWDNANSSQFYRPYLFSCPVPKDRHELVAVSLVAEKCQNPQNVFHTLQEQGNTDNVGMKDFVVCLKPLDFRNDASLRLLEWLELQYLLGVDKIATYVYRLHPNMTKVLKHYESSGRLSIKLHVLPGEEPNEPDERTQYFRSNIWQKRRHEMIPYNDCLYEHLNSHRFVVNLDLDEAIVPMMHDTWLELLEHVFSDHKEALKTYSSLSAANVYFFDEFGELEDSSIPPYMHMLRHVYRSANFSSPGFAVKSFHSTNNTLAVFNHYTLIPLYHNLRRNALISRHLAQLHHYRATCPALMERECQTNFMKFYKQDTTMWKFKEPLVQNVQRIARELNLISL